MCTIVQVNEPQNNKVCVCMCVCVCPTGEEDLCDLTLSYVLCIAVDNV